MKLSLLTAPRTAGKPGLPRPSTYGRGGIVGFVKVGKTWDKHVLASAIGRDAVAQLVQLPFEHCGRWVTYFGQPLWLQETRRVPGEVCWQTIATISLPVSFLASSRAPRAYEGHNRGQPAPVPPIDSARE